MSSIKFSTPVMSRDSSGSSSSSSSSSVDSKYMRMKKQEQPRAAALSVALLFPDLKKVIPDNDEARLGAAFLAVENHRRINPCPLKELKPKFDKQNQRKNEWPVQFLVTTTGKGLLEGCFAISPFKPVVNFIFACSKSVLGDLCQNSNARHEVDHVTQLKDECTQLSLELEAQYETVAKHLVDRYLRTKFKFYQDNNMEALILQVTRIFNNFLRLEIALQEGLIRDLQMDRKKILAPLHNAICNILQDHGTPNIPDPHPTSKTDFQAKNEVLKGKRAFQDALDDMKKDSDRAKIILAKAKLQQAVKRIIAKNKRLRNLAPLIKGMRKKPNAQAATVLPLPKGKGLDHMIKPFSFKSAVQLAQSPTTTVQDSPQAFHLPKITDHQGVGALSPPPSPLSVPQGKGPSPMPAVQLAQSPTTTVQDSPQAFHLRKLYSANYMQETIRTKMLNELEKALKKFTKK